MSSVIRSRMRVYLLILICAGLSAPALTAQVNYYVRPDGDNGGSGKYSNPWKTVQYGINQLASGDTLNLTTGTYKERIRITKSNICLRGMPGFGAVISGQGGGAENALIEINGASGVWLHNLEISDNTQNDAQGILIEGSAKDVTVEGCTIHDIHFSSNPSAPVSASTNAQGIIVYGDKAGPCTNIHIIRNTLYNCRLGYSEGITVNGNVAGFEIGYNTVRDLTNIGVDLVGHEGVNPNPAADQARDGRVHHNTVWNCVSPYATSAGIYVDGARAVVLENNTCYGNGYGIEVGCEHSGKTADTITVQDNVLYKNLGPGIALGGYDYPAVSGTVAFCIVRQNTVYNNDLSGSGMGELYLTHSRNTVVEGNILFAGTQNLVVSADNDQPGLRFDYNVLYCKAGVDAMEANWHGQTYTGFAAFLIATATNPHSMFTDPLLRSPNATPPDFHISQNSPARDGGNPAYKGIYEVDMDGEVRWLSIVDCGADEWFPPVMSVPLPAPVPGPGGLYPNPSTGYCHLPAELPDAFYTVELYDAVGRRLALLKEFWRDAPLHIQGLAPGTYLVLVKSTNGAMFTYTLLKQ